MEENIEHWHVKKLEKYSKLVCPGWQVHFLILEVGCRGFVPSRVVSLLRKLGLTSPESRTLCNNLQLVARKCSYVIWINRFNKDFNPALRISADGVSLTEGITPDVLVSSTLSKEVRDRISRSRDSAILRLRISRNRRAALLRLNETRGRKTGLFNSHGHPLVYRARASPSGATPATAITGNLQQTLSPSLPDQKIMDFKDQLEVRVDPLSRLPDGPPCLPDQKITESKEQLEVHVILYLVCPMVLLVTPFQF
jgi:hypothetical protein